MLKKHLMFWAFFYIVQCNLIAQNNLKIGLSVSPAFTQITYKARYITEKWYPSFLCNLNLGWHKKQHTRYSVGVGYSYLKSQVTGDERSSFRFTHQEIVVPFDFYFSEKEHQYNHWFAKTGLALSMNLRKRGYSEPFFQQNQVYIPYRFIELFGSIGSGYTRHINSKTSVSLNLNFRTNAVSQMLIFINNVYSSSSKRIDLPPFVYCMGLECSIWFQ